MYECSLKGQCGIRFSAAGFARIDPIWPEPQLFFFKFSFEFEETFEKSVDDSVVSDSLMPYQRCWIQCQSCHVYQGIHGVSGNADAESSFWDTAGTASAVPDQWWAKL